jgi:hypothetical protein
MAVPFTGSYDPVVNRKENRREEPPTRRRRFRRTESRGEEETLQLLLDRQELLGDEVRRKCGEPQERSPERIGHRYGKQRGVITMSGQELAGGAPARVEQ